MSVLQQVRQETPTQTQSLTLMRNLLRTAVSTIAYLRHLFPEDCFRDKALAGINIKSLYPSNEEAKLLCNWIEDGLFDALSKKYLRAMIFGIYLDPTKPNTLVECYYFRFTYGENADISVDMRRTGGGQRAQVKVQSPAQITKDQIKKSTVSCLRNLVTISQTLKPLPDARFITMKLLYYDKITPVDYEPKFFHSASYEESLHFEAEPVKLKVGEINTSFHTLNLRIKTTVDSFDDSIDEEPMSQPLPNRKYCIEDSGESDTSDSSADDAEEVDDHVDEEEDEEQEEAAENVNAVSFEGFKEKVLKQLDKPVTISRLKVLFPSLASNVISDYLERMLRGGVLAKGSNGRFLAPSAADKPMTTDDNAMFFRAVQAIKTEESLSATKLQAKLATWKVPAVTVKGMLARMEREELIAVPSGRRRTGRFLVHQDKVQQWLTNAPHQPNNKAEEEDKVEDDDDEDKVHVYKGNNSKATRSAFPKKSLRKRKAAPSSQAQERAVPPPTDDDPNSEQKKCSVIKKPLHQQQTKKPRTC